MSTSHIRMQPWIGTNYKAGFNGVKTLIVGESVYDWTKDKSGVDWDPDLTIGTIGEQLTGEPPIAFHTKIATAFLGKSPDLEDKKGFWHQVAFYNYVQESVGDAARVRPTAEHWANSEAAFAEILHDLQPEMVVVLGFGHWEHIVELEGGSGPALLGARWDCTYLYQHSTGYALAFGIQHPSSGFSPPRWHPVLLAGIELAKTKPVPA
jgi:hypothetical protein